MKILTQKIFEIFFFYPSNLFKKVASLKKTELAGILFNAKNLKRIRRCSSAPNFAALGIKSPKFSRTEMRVHSSLIDYRL